MTCCARSPRCSAQDEWILHAADQDLPCLAEVGLRPPSLYDTELAGRLAGFDRVNLATMVRAAAGSGPGQGPRRGRLVQAPAAAGLAQLRGPGRGGAPRTARGDRGGAWPSKAKPIGPQRNSSICEPRDPGGDDGGHGGRPAGPLATHLGPAPGARPASPGRRPRIVDHRATTSPSAATSHPAASCPTRPSSTPPWPTRRRSKTSSRCRCSAAASSAAAPRCGWRRWKRRGKTGTRRTRPSRRTARRRRRAGRSASRRPPRGWMRPAPRWRKCRSGLRCRRRTWSHPTWYDGCAGTGRHLGPGLEGGCPGRGRRRVSARRPGASVATGTGGAGAGRGADTGGRRRARRGSRNG